MGPSKTEKDGIGIRLKWKDYVIVTVRKFWSKWLATSNMEYFMHYL